MRMRTERHNQPLPSETVEERCQNEFGSTYQERTGEGYSCLELLLVENNSVIRQKTLKIVNKSFLVE